MEELTAYLGKVKQGTTPGFSGIPVELWVESVEDVQYSLLQLFNECMTTGDIPKQWEYRLIRLLAKSETAVGLEDVRPITLLDVTQKLLTGILNDRIMAIWNTR